MILKLFPLFLSLSSFLSSRVSVLDTVLGVDSAPNSHTDPLCFLSLSLCVGERLVGRVYLPQRPWTHHGQQQLLCHGKMSLVYCLKMKLSASSCRWWLFFGSLNCCVSVALLQLCQQHNCVSMVINDSKFNY